MQRQVRLAAARVQQAAAPAARRCALCLRLAPASPLPCSSCSPIDRSSCGRQTGTARVTGKPHAPDHAGERAQQVQRRAAQRASALRRPQPPAGAPHLGGVDLLKVLRDVEHALRDLVLVEVATACKAPPEGRGRRCRRVAAALLQRDAPHVPQHGLPELLHGCGERRAQITHTGGRGVALCTAAVQDGAGNEARGSKVASGAEASKQGRLRPREGRAPAGAPAASRLGTCPPPASTTIGDPSPAPRALHL